MSERQPQPAPQDMSRLHVLVFVDIPDIDNLKMVLSVIRSNPNRHVKIILSPRPVDFTACWLGNENERDQIKTRLPQHWTGFEKQCRAIMPYMETPQIPLWFQEISDTVLQEKYFGPEKSVSDLIDDTKNFYMEISAYRFTNFLIKCGVDESRFEIYWDEASLQPGMIQHGVRSSYHAPDWCYDFEPVARSDALSILKDVNLTDAERRHGLVELCKTYIAKQKNKHGKKSKLLLFQKLIHDQKKNFTIDMEQPVMVGGPFTEIVKWIKSGFTVKDIVAMAGFTEGYGNFFPNQFNIHVDFNSAWELFNDLAKNREIRIRMLPTECVKRVTGVHGVDYQLTPDMLDKVYRVPGAIAMAVRELAYLVNALLGGRPLPYYDWVAAVMHRIPTHIRGVETDLAFPIAEVEAYQEHHEWDEAGNRVHPEKIVPSPRLTNEQINYPAMKSNEERGTYTVMCFGVVRRLKSLEDHALNGLQQWLPEGGKAHRCGVLVDQLIKDVTV